MNKALDPEDLRLWWLNTRDVDPLGEALEKPEGLRKRELERKARYPALQYTQVEKPQVPFHHKSRSVLRKQIIEAEIDLHGYSQDQAWDALDVFFSSSRNQGKRTVLVITGKGSLASDQTLRVQVPRWFSELPLSKHVLGYQQSLQRDGGSGAY